MSACPSSQALRLLTVNIHKGYNAFNRRHLLHELRDVPTCTVATGATLSFGAVAAPASAGAVSANSGSSFWLNWTSDVTAAPSLHSATPRTLTSGGSSLPFALRAVTPGGAELPTASPGAPREFTPSGSNQTVTLHAQTHSSNFRLLPAGAYARSIALTLYY